MLFFFSLTLILCCSWLTHLTDQDVPSYITAPVAQCTFRSTKISPLLLGMDLRSTVYSLSCSLSASSLQEMMKEHAMCLCVSVQHYIRRKQEPNLMTKDASWEDYFLQHKCSFLLLCPNMQIQYCQNWS